jgi:hypothetical protein
MMVHWSFPFLLHGDKATSPLWSDIRTKRSLDMRLDGSPQQPLLTMLTFGWNPGLVDLAQPIFDVTSSENVEGVGVGTNLS